MSGNAAMISVEVGTVVVIVAFLRLCGRGRGDKRSKSQQSNFLACSANEVNTQVFTEVRKDKRARDTEKEQAKI